MALSGESRVAASEVVPGGSRGGLGPVLKMPWLCPGSLGMAILTAQVVAEGAES